MPQRHTAAYPAEFRERLVELIRFSGHRARVVRLAPGPVDT